MVDAIRTRIETTMMHAREIEENLLCLQMSIRQTQRLQRTSLPGNLELVHEYPTCRKEKKRKEKVTTSLLKEQENLTNMAEIETMNTAKRLNVYPHISSKQVEPLPIATLSLQGSKKKRAVREELKWLHINTAGISKANASSSFTTYHRQ